MTLPLACQLDATWRRGDDVKRREDEGAEDRRREARERARRRPQIPRKRLGRAERENCSANRRGEERPKPGADRRAGDQSRLGNGFTVVSEGKRRAHCAAFALA